VTVVYINQTVHILQLVIQQSNMTHSMNFKQQGNSNKNNKTLWTEDPRAARAVRQSMSMCRVYVWPQINRQLQHTTTTTTTTTTTRLSLVPMTLVTVALATVPM